jgi:hypothetical protein
MKPRESMLFGGKNDGKVIETNMPVGSIFFYDGEYFLIRQRPLNAQINLFKAISISQEIAEEICTNIEQLGN